MKKEKEEFKRTSKKIVNNLLNFSKHMRKVSKVLKSKEKVEFDINLN